MISFGSLRSVLQENSPNRRNVFLFGLTSFLNDTASEMAYWILPAFLISLGAGPMQLGVIEGIAESVAAGAKWFSGYLADRSPRRKPLVVGGYVVANIAKPLLAVAGSWWHVLLIRFADRTAKGIRGSARDVMLAESAEPGRLGSAFGLVQAMDSAGAIAGPLLALFIVAHWSVRTVFWAAAIPGSVCVLVVTLFVRETTHTAGAAKAPRVSGDQKLPSAFFYLLGVVALFSLGNSSDMFLVLRAKDVGIGARSAPIIGLVFNIVYTLGSWPAGRLSDKVRRSLVAAAGYAVFAVTYYFFAKAPSAKAIWISMAFYGLYYALTNAVLRAMVVDVAPPTSKGRALGIFYFATSVTTLAASLITGGLWSHYGAAVPFYFSSALAMTCSALLLAYGLTSGPRQKKA